MIPRSQHVLLLTGAPGVGKTTVIRRVAEGLAGRRVGGFYTEEIRVRGVRQGFRLTTFDGQETIMAHVTYPKTHRVGRYGVDVAAIDTAIEHALRPGESIDVYLVDEIGKMECLSTRFVARIRTVVSYNRPVVATVAQTGSGFISEVKRQADAELWQVTRANRAQLPAQALGWIGARLHQERSDRV